jgi:hypothetical protein
MQGEGTMRKMGTRALVRLITKLARMPVAFATSFA